MNQITFTWKKRISQKRRQSIADEIARLHNCTVLNDKVCMAIITPNKELFPIMLFLTLGSWTAIQ